MADVSFQDVWGVLRWVLLVLVAGFIGQFGRHAAQRLLERRRQARLASHPEEEAKLQKKLAKAQLKAEKKRAKALAKKQKKAQG